MRCGLAGVDRVEPCVRHRRPHERHVDGVQRREIIDVVGLTSEKPWIFDTPDRVAEDRTGCSHARGW